MRLTKKEWDRFRPINNWVVIQPNRGADEIVLNKGTKDEMKFYVDFAYNPNKHVPVVGTAVKVPEKINYCNNKRKPGFFNSLQWKTEMELREGDTVFYNYLAGSTALGLEQNNYGQNYTDKRVITVEGDSNIYIMVKYDRVYVAKRKDDVIPVNGFMLVEPMDKQYFETFLHIPEMVKNTNKKSSTYGIVRYKGSRLEEYHDRPMYKDPSNSELKVGDLVALNDVSDIPLEWDLHSEFEGNKTFYRVQGKDIYAIIKDYEKVKEEYIPLVAPEENE